MPPDRLDSGFDAIRAWRGSTSKGFEELCYQLFKSDVPDGARAIRTGNPDGGVEWYATLADGTEVFCLRQSEALVLDSLF